MLQFGFSAFLENTITYDFSLCFHSHPQWHLWGFVVSARNLQYRRLFMFTPPTENPSISLILRMISSVYYNLCLVTWCSLVWLPFHGHILALSLRCIWLLPVGPSTNSLSCSSTNSWPSMSSAMACQIKGSCLTLSKAFTKSIKHTSRSLCNSSARSVIISK